MKSFYVIQWVKSSFLYVRYSYKSANCPGRLIRYLTEEDEDKKYKMSKEHTHEGNATIASAAVVMQNLKTNAAASNDFGRNVISKVCTNLSPAVSATLPGTSAMLQTVRRARYKVDLPVNPDYLSELFIPEKFKKFNDEQFLLHDSGPSEDRILIFSTRRNLKFLKRAKVALMDGTFDIVPPLFEQLYTIQGTCWRGTNVRV